MVVAFTGPYCDNNFGDYLMLINNIWDIYTANDNVLQIIIFGYEFKTLKLVVDKYLKGYPIKLVEIQSLVKNKGKISKKFEVEYNNEWLMPNEIINTIANIDTVAEAVSEVDVLILSGGGCFNYYWLSEHRKWKLYSIVAPMIIARQKNKRIVTMGNTFGPWGNYRSFFFSLLNYIDIDMYSVRDNLYSRKELNCLGIFNNIYDNIDDLYFLNNIYSINYNTSDEKYFVIELYCSIEELEQNIIDIQKFVQYMKRKWNYKAVFLSFGESFGGQKQGEFLKDKISDIQLCYIENSFLELEMCENIIRNAQFVICNRYHALVRAISNEVPCVQYLRSIDGSRYYYYNKGVGFLKGIFGNKYLEDIEKLYFCTSIKEMFKNYSDTENKLEIQKKLLGKKKNFDLLQKRLTYIKECLLNDNT